MASTIDQLVEQIRSLQSELEAELAIRRANLNYTLHSGRARFEQEVLRAHRALRVNLARYERQSCEQGQILGAVVLKP